MLDRHAISTSRFGLAAPDSPASFLALAAIRARKEAMAQVFAGEPVSVFQGSYSSEHPLAGLELLLFPPSPKIAGNHVVSHGLTLPALRPPVPGQIVDDRFSGLGMEICLRFDDDGDPDQHAAYAEACAALIFETAESLVVDAPYRTLLPGDVLQTDDDDMLHSSWLVIDGGPFRNRLVLPTGHCHLVQLVPFANEAVDMTAHLSGEKRAAFAELLDVKRSISGSRSPIIEHRKCASALAELES
ncbi:MAG: hypothetical protein GY822_05680 [Deltaproteobacteria bacterium]|nr:hypothetical protein [Deltaproteobacteria bacterium]